MNHGKTSTKKKKILIVSAILIGLALIFYFTRKSDRISIHYKTITAKRGNIEVTILTTGTVNPENRLAIQSPIAGRAEEVLVDQGYLVKKGQILGWVSSTERASLLDGARAEGPEEVKKWEALYKPTPVLAPVNGMIIQRNIQPGQTFSTTDAILVMSDHLIVQAQVDETDIAQIHLKQDAEIILDAYPNEKIQGRVHKIAYDAKTTNNVTTYNVDVLPVQVPAFMRSGMTANVTLPLGSKTDVIVVPSDAVKSKDGQPYVLIPNPSGKGESTQRNVTLGISDGKQVEITSGLAENESVLEPEFKLGTPKEQGGSPFMPKIGGKKH